MGYSQSNVVVMGLLRVQILSYFLIVSFLLSLTVPAQVKKEVAKRKSSGATSSMTPERLVSNVVRIEAQMRDHTENGFGFIVGQRNQTLYVVTAYHVISNPDEVDRTNKVNVKVEFADHRGETYEAKVIGTHDVAHDLAVLTVPVLSGFHWIKECLGVSADQKRAAEVWFIGRDQNWYVSVVPGRIASLSPLDSRLDLEGLAIHPGSSGAPLVGRSGIVGMIQNDSVDGTKALSIDFIQAAFQNWMHPWDLLAAKVEEPISSTTSVAGPENPLREGNYQLHSWRGAPQKLGVIMSLQKVSEDRFLVETKIPNGTGWSGELSRRGEEWELRISNISASLAQWPDTATNPANGWYKIFREGALLKFTSATATWEWQQQ